MDAQSFKRASQAFFMAKTEPRSLAEGDCIQWARLGVQEAEGLGAQGQPTMGERKSLCKHGHPSGNLV